MTARFAATAAGLLIVSASFGMPGWAAPPAEVAPPSAAPGGPAPSAGLTLQVNAFTASNQANAALGIAPDGAAIVAWDSRRQDAGTSGVFARAVSADGVALSPEVRLNTWTPGQQHRPAVAVTQGGDVWVTWASIGQDSDGSAVVARRFGPRLSPGTAEVLVNAGTPGNQHSPAISVDAQGRALIAWNDESPGNDAPGVRTRLLGRDGTALTEESRLDGGAERCGAPCLARDPRTGGFVVAWGAADAAGQPLGLVWRRVDDRGLPSGPVRWLDGCGGVEPSVAVDREGRLVAAWMVGADEGYSVRARWFDAEGAPLGPAVTIADAAGGTTSGAAVALDGDPTPRSDGGAGTPDAGPSCTIAYNRADPEHGRATIFVSAFGPDGAIGPGWRLLGALPPGRGEQRLACAAGGLRLACAGDRLVAAWSGDAGLDDRSAAHVTFAEAEEPVCEAVNVLSGDEGGAMAVPAVLTGADGAFPGPGHLPPVLDPHYNPQAPLAESGPADGEFGFETVPGTAVFPPDPALAVGPEHFVAIVNGQIAFFNKNGVNTFRQALGNPGFWGTVGSANFVFDPEALYDPWTDRFWVMACEWAAGGSFFTFAVSDDADPNGAWHKYRIHMTPANADVDSPNFAVDGEALYLAADFIVSGNTHRVLMLPKAPLLAGQPAPAGTTLITGLHGSGMARAHGEPAPAQYLVQAHLLASNATVTLHALRDPLGTPTRVAFTLPVASYQWPESPPQLGSSVTMWVTQPRFWSCVYRSGSVWATHHVRTPSSGGRTIVRWYEFATNGWPASGLDPAVKQWGEVDPGPGLHAYFASIGADAQGNAALTFARSGVSEFIGMWRAVRRWNDPPGVFRPMALVRASTSPYAHERWGDYSATEPDPARGCTFWGHHEFVTTTNFWRTWAGRYRIFARCDINEDCALTVQDFGAFQAIFGLGDPRADFDGNGLLTVADFGAFQTAFVTGCP